MDVRRSVGRLFAFATKVIRDFRRNQGLLLSGALAYYTLLSVMPLSILALVVLSHFVREERLFYTLSTYTEMVIPGYASILTEQVRVFLEYREAIGIIGFLAMLFFSSMAFSVLENAMSVIFVHRTRAKRRHFLISAIIPYLYMLSIGLSIGLISFAIGALDYFEERQLVLFGLSLGFPVTFGVALYGLGMLGEVLMLTSIYLIMPEVRITFRHALIGGVLAMVLWEITRHVMVWYYSSLSMVNLVYGSFATAVVALLTMEAAAVILLLGAQVIAEMEDKSIGEQGERRIEIGA